MTAALDASVARTSSPSGGGDPRATTCSVIVCTYSFERIDDLRACLRSIEVQRRRPDETIVVVDHNPELERAVAGRGRVIPNSGLRGLSHARNTGIAAATADVVAFIDDDAVAEPDWLEELLAPFADPAVAAVGGRIRPGWPTRRPAWFPPHLDWTVGCSNPGLPTDVAPVRNVFGASAAFRRSALVGLGGFPVDLGRVGTDVAGCEETQVCIRLRQTARDHPDRAVVCAPRSVVHHRVTPARATVRYVLRRCAGEGRSKARLATAVGATDAVSDERGHALRILRAVVDDVLGGLRQPRRITRAAVATAGLTCAAAAYAAERIAIGGRRRWA